MKDIPEDDAERETVSELVWTLTRSGSINATHLSKQPASRSVNLLEMLLGSSGH